MNKISAYAKLSQEIDRKKYYYDYYVIYVKL